MANDGLQDKEHRQRQQKQQQQHQQHQQQQQCIPTSQATSQYGRLGSDHRPSHSQPSLSPLLSTLRLLQTPQSQHSSPAPQQQQQPAHRTLKRLHLPRLPVPAASDAGLAETLSIRRALSFDLLGGRSNSTSQPSDTQSLRSALQRRHSETVKHHSNRDLDHARPSPVSRRPSFPLRLVPVQSPTSSSASPRTIKPTNSNSNDQDTSVIEQPATDDPDRTVAESSVQHPSNLKSCSATHALEISFEYITDERVHRKTASTRKPLPRIGGPTLAPASIFPASNSAISSTSSLLPPPPLLPLSALLVCPPHLRPLLPVGPVSSSVHPAFLQRALILAARAAQSQEHKQELATALQPHGTRPHQTHTTASPVAAVACSDIDLRPRSCDRESATTASGSRPGSSESTAASMSFPNRYSQRPSNAGVGVGTSMRSPGSIANQAALLASSSLGPRSISRMSYRSDRSDSTHLGGGGGGGAPSYISITSSSLLGAQDTLSPSPGVGVVGSLDMMAAGIESGRGSGMSGVASKRGSVVATPMASSGQTPSSGPGIARFIPAHVRRKRFAEAVATRSDTSHGKRPIAVNRASVATVAASNAKGQLMASQGTSSAQSGAAGGGNAPPSASANPSAYRQTYPPGSDAFISRAINALQDSNHDALRRGSQSVGIPSRPQSASFAPARGSKMHMAAMAKHGADPAVIQRIYSSYGASLGPDEFRVSQTAMAASNAAKVAAVQAAVSAMHGHAAGITNYGLHCTGYDAPHAKSSAPAAAATTATATTAVAMPTAPGGQPSTRSSVNTRRASSASTVQSRHKSNLLTRTKLEELFFTAMRSSTSSTSSSRLPSYVVEWIKTQTTRELMVQSGLAPTAAEGQPTEAAEAGPCVSSGVEGDIAASRNKSRPSTAGTHAPPHKTKWELDRERRLREIDRLRRHRGFQTSGLDVDAESIPACTNTQDAPVLSSESAPGDHGVIRRFKAAAEMGDVDGWRVGDLDMEGLALTGEEDSIEDTRMAWMRAITTAPARLDDSVATSLIDLNTQHEPDQEQRDDQGLGSLLQPQQQQQQPQDDDGSDDGAFLMIRNNRGPGAGVPVRPDSASTTSSATRSSTQVYKRSMPGVACRGPGAGAGVGVGAAGMRNVTITGKRWAGDTAGPGVNPGINTRSGMQGSRQPIQSGPVHSHLSVSGMSGQAGGPDALMGQFSDIGPDDDVFEMPDLEISWEAIEQPFIGSASGSWHAGSSQHPSSKQLLAKNAHHQQSTISQPHRLAALAKHTESRHTLDSQHCGYKGGHYAEDTASDGDASEDSFLVPDAADESGDMESASSRPASSSINSRRLQQAKNAGDLISQSQSQSQLHTGHPTVPSLSPTRARRRYASHGPAPAALLGRTIGRAKPKPAATGAGSTSGALPQTGMASVQTPEAGSETAIQKEQPQPHSHSQLSLATEPTSRTSSLQKPDPKSKKGKTSSLGGGSQKQPKPAVKTDAIGSAALSDGAQSGRPSSRPSTASKSPKKKTKKKRVSDTSRLSSRTSVTAPSSRYSATSLASASTSTVSAAAASSSLHAGRQAADTSRPQVSRPSTASSVSIRSALKQQPSLSSSALHAHRTAVGSQPAGSFVSRSVIIGPKRAMSHAGIAPADTTAAAHTDSSAGQQVHQGMSQDVHAEQRPQRMYRSMDPALTGSSSSIASSARLSVAPRKTVGPQLSPQAGPRGRTAVPQSGGAGHVGQRGPNAADR